MTSLFTAPVERGRHRPGRPGRVPVGFFVSVLYRGLLLSWRQPGRHRQPVTPRPAAVRTRVPAPAI